MHLKVGCMGRERNSRSQSERGETKRGISSRAIEGRGSLVCWAIADREWVRIRLRLQKGGQYLRGAIIEMMNNSRKDGREERHNRGVSRGTSSSSS